jgi:ribonuclease HII
MLYDSKKYELKDSKELPNKRRKEIQKEDFDIWFQDAEIFL